jgi:hypothetical protein
VVKVGFVVEGISDKKLIESSTFKDWAKQACGLEVLDEVVDAGGNGNMCSQKIEVFVQKLMTQAQPDKIVVLSTEAQVFVHFTRSKTPFGNGFPDALRRIVMLVAQTLFVLVPKLSLRRGNPNRFNNSSVFIDCSTLR